MSDSVAASTTSSSLALYQDWKHPRNALGYTGGQYGYEQNAILRCVTNTMIPCTAEMFASVGKMRFKVTVLSIAHFGQAKAPNKKGSGSGGKYVKMDNAKALFESIRDQDSITGVKMYSFKKANSNTDRGDRDDETFAEIHVGQVLTFWVHDFMYIGKESRKGGGAPVFVFPTNISSIPEFTIIDMFIMPGHNANDNGYGVNIKKIRLHPTTLYSYLTPQSLLSIPSSLMESMKLAEARMEESRFIHNAIEVKDISFFARVPANSFIASSPVCDGVYRMVGDGGRELFPGVPCVDINVTDLLKFANMVVGDEGDAMTSKDDCVLDAITLFDFASAADSLYLYVTSVSSFKSRDPALSEFLAVPLVDSDRFLRSVDIQEDESEASQVVDGELIFPFKHEIANFSDRAVMSVYLPAVSRVGGIPAPCPDFALMCEGCAVAKGYRVTIGKDDAPDVLRFIFNVMGFQTSPNKSSSRLDYASRGPSKRKAPEGSSPEGDE